MLSFAYPQSSTEISARSEYGDFGVILQRRYAEEHAWVSPFVMTAKDLYLASRLLKPEAARELSHSFDEIDGAGFRISLQPFEKAIFAALSSLHRSDFTIAQFEYLIKNQLLTSIKELKDSDDSGLKLAAALSEIRKIDEEVNANSLLMPAVIRRLVLGRLNLPTWFEGRVPVAVPHQHVIHFTPD